MSVLTIPKPKGPPPLRPEQETTVRAWLERGDAVTVVAWRLGVKKSQVLAVKHRMKAGCPYAAYGEHEEAATCRTGEVV